MTRVFPLPAPARINTGPSVVSTASRCCGFSWSRNDNEEIAPELAISILQGNRNWRDQRPRTRRLNPECGLALGRRRRRSFYIAYIAACEGKKRRPIRSWCVSACMLAKRDIAVDQRGLNRRKLRRPHILLSQ